jgi:hypothetical protein
MTRLGELAAVVSILSEHREILFDLEGFEPVGSLSESIREVLAGSGSLSRADLDRLRRWSSRWSSLSVEVRTFYRVALREFDDPDSRERRAVERAIWRLVEPSTDGRAVDSDLVRTLDRLHSFLLGRSSGSDLLPLPSPEFPR